MEEPHRSEFVQEVIHSNVPVVLGEAKPEPVPVNIYWRGGGEKVVLARAGDDNWRGRQPMEYEYVLLICSDES